MITSRSYELYKTDKIVVSCVKCDSCLLAVLFVKFTDSATAVLSSFSNTTVFMFHDQKPNYKGSAKVLIHQLKEIQATE